MKENMFYGAGPLIFEKAKELREKTTPAEKRLWNFIRINEWALKFRRQHPVQNYVVDFYCHSLKLVIEVDGSIHELEEVKRNDISRENNLKELGLTIIRFKDEEVFESKRKVMERIGSIVEQLKNDPSEAKTEVMSNKPNRNMIREFLSPPLGERGEGERLFIIKVGGNVIDEKDLLSSFLNDFAAIKEKKILIHGGGKIATRLGERLGILSKYQDGRRITDEETIDLVTMVYGGLVNKKIVARLQALDCNALGITGADGNTIPAIKRPVKDIDYGFVGDVKNESIATNTWNLFLNNHLVPVVASLTHDGKGQLLNTNADTIASSLAIALSGSYQVRLIYCFEKKGVLENLADENSVIPVITNERYQQLLEEKKLFDGILPKIDNAFSAIKRGVQEVLIGHARDLYANTTDTTKGTLIK
jgi:acetylglutamate kinase